MEQQQQPIMVNEITIKGEKLNQLMNYIDDLPHKIGKQLETFLQQVASENLLEKEKPKEEDKTETDK